MYPIVINLYKCDLLGLKVHWYQNLLFVFNCHLIQHLLLTNSLRPSSFIHSLQIYCPELIGPRSHTFWAWAVNIPPTGSIWSISVHFNPTWAHTMPECLTGKEWALLYGQHELMDNQFLKPSLPRLYSNKEKRKKKHYKLYIQFITNLFLPLSLSVFIFNTTNYSRSPV